MSLANDSGTEARRMVSPISTSIEKQRLFSVQALRGVAALAVAWFHLTNGYEWNWLRWSGAYGYLGVDAFFVISGFVIPYSLRGTGYRIGQFPRFLLRRIVRLEPPYLVSVCLAVALWYVAAKLSIFKGQQFDLGVGRIAAHAFYLVPLTRYEWLSPVYWTLLWELLFYIFVGFLYPIIERGHPAAIIAALVSLMGAAIVLPDLPTSLHFVTGIVAFRYFIGRDSLPTAALLMAACVGLTWFYLDFREAFTGLATALVIVFAKIPQWRWLAFLGTISYSLYLLHVMVGGKFVNLAQRFASGRVFDLAISLGGLALSIAAASVYWWVLERPAQKASRSIALRAPNTEQKNAAG